MDKKEVIMVVAKDLMFQLKLTTSVKDDADRVAKLATLYGDMVKRIAVIYDSLA